MRGRDARVLLASLMLMLIVESTVAPSEQQESEGDWATQAALQRMQMVPIFQEARLRIPNLLSEVRLERGNYAWGGYDVIRLWETSERVTQLQSSWGRSGRLSSRPMAREKYQRLWTTLEGFDVWNLGSNFTAPCDDCSTYFITLEHRGRQHRMVVYAPDLLAEQGTSAYWAVIQAIETLKSFGEDRDQD